MARSSYIYLAFNKFNQRLRGAWTVKYEMMNAIEGRENDLNLFRVPDSVFDPMITKVDNPKKRSKCNSTQ